ncbi:MAG: hypothetical protein V1916_00095 [Patescibacteria group bacterium]
MSPDYGLTTVEWGWLRQHLRGCTACCEDLGKHGADLFHRWLPGVVAGSQPNRTFSLVLVDSRRCPSPELLEQYVGGALHGAEKSAIMIHLRGHRGDSTRSCRSCQSVVTLLKQVRFK